MRQLSLSSTPLHLREATPYPNCSNLPLSKPNDQAIDEAGPISVSNKGDCHSHSHYNPPSPAHHRQPSLCSRLSLPSLRRHWNRHDDMPPPTVADHNIDDTVQVQDLDFKLVKPMTQLQVMSSEDLFASNGQGHVSTGMSHLQPILIVELLISNSFFQVRLASQVGISLWSAVFLSLRDYVLATCIFSQSKCILCLSGIRLMK